MKKDLKLNEEEKKQKKIEEQKKIEKENENNIESTILYMSVHIDGDRTKEYLKFAKEERKLKEKIARKKAKIARKGALDEAYLRRESRIVPLYEYMKRNNNSIGEMYNVRSGQREYIYTFDNMSIMRAINKAEKNLCYIEQTSIDPYNCVNNNWVERCSDISNCKDLKELLQKHYNNINARIMKFVLEYYTRQLEYWKNYLRELEELEEVKELE